MTSFNFLKKLPTPAEIKADYPVTAKVEQIKKERDEMIRKVFTGESDKFLVIIGPCSADNEDAVCEYINRLARVQEKVSDRLILIPRIYTNKPRTTGEGYKGILHQPDPEKKPDLLHGLIALRKMHMRAIEESGLTAADEMLYPENWRYLDDILSYVAIGARSVENQQHRLVVSGMDIPAGMKRTSGDFSVMLNLWQLPRSNRTLFIVTGKWKPPEIPLPIRSCAALSTNTEMLFPTTTMRTCSFFWKNTTREIWQTRQ